MYLKPNLLAIKSLFMALIGKVDMAKYSQN